MTAFFPSTLQCEYSQLMAIYSKTTYLLDDCLDKLWWQEKKSSHHFHQAKDSGQFTFEFPRHGQLTMIESPPKMPTKFTTPMHCTWLAGLGNVRVGLHVAKASFLPSRTDAQSPGRKP
jgi:hypothetical protein